MAKKTALIFFILSSIAGLGFYMFFTASDKGQANQEGNLVPAYQVQSTDIVEVVKTLGNLSAIHSLTLSATVTEIVHKIYFQEGEFVSAGQILVELISNEEHARLAQAQSNLREKQAIFDRTQALFRQKVVPQARLDEDRRILKDAVSQLKTAEVSLSDRRIVAPFSGVLGLRNISEGSLITPGTPMVTLDDTSELKLDFQLPSRFLSGLHLGQIITAETTAYPGKVFTAPIQVIEPRIDPQTSLITVRAYLKNTDALLKPGLFMTVHYKSQPRKSLVVPEISTLSLGDQKFVLKINKDKTITQIRIKIGSLINGFYEVLEGIEEDDLIVYEGLQLLRQGQTITPRRVSIVPQLSPTQKPEAMT